jgi:hypothetical protein
MMAIYTRSEAIPDTQPEIPSNCVGKNLVIENISFYGYSAVNIGREHRFGTITATGIYDLNGEDEESTVFLAAPPVIQQYVTDGSTLGSYSAGHFDVKWRLPASTHQVLSTVDLPDDWVYYHTMTSFNGYCVEVPEP